MSKSVSELNQMAQEVANKIGFISQELLQKVYDLAHSEDAAANAAAETPSTDA